MMAKKKLGHTHSTTRNGKKYIWRTKRLWEFARGLEPFDVEVESFKVLDRDGWFGEDHPPTIREVAMHCHRINEADTNYPIVLNYSGKLIDGGHRLARTLLEGRKTIIAVPFPEMPEPDAIQEL